MSAYLREARKALVVIVGLLAQLVVLNVLPDPWDKIAAGIVGIGQVLGVYTATNTPRQP